MYFRGTAKLVFVNKNKKYFKMIKLSKCYYLGVSWVKNIKLLCLLQMYFAFTFHLVISKKQDSI